jgi:SET family sugar efflux transporter-like MFS transporter
MSYTSVWASETFGLGPQGVAMLFVVSGAAGALGNPLLGLASDRLGARRWFVVAQLVVTGAAYGCYALASRYEVGLLLVAFSGFGIMGMTLASVGDYVQSEPRLGGTVGLRVVSTERTAWAMGIIVGPAAAALIVTLADGVRPVFAVAALVHAAAALFAAAGAEPPRRRPTARAGAVAPGWTGARRAALGLLVAGLILLTLPGQTRNTYLPLFITAVLGEARGAVGPAFTLNAMTAVLVMPHMGSLSSRIGPERVLYLGGLTGLLYCALQSLSASYPTTLAIQTLIGVAISLWSTAGLIYLQRLLPDRIGMAGGLYLTVFQITPIVSGLVLGPIAESRGIASAFSTTAALVVVGLAVVAAAHRRLYSLRPSRTPATAR